MAFSLSFLSQISSEISKVKVFRQIFIHTHTPTHHVVSGPNFKLGLSVFYHRHYVNTTQFVLLS